MFLSQEELITPGVCDWDRVVGVLWNCIVDIFWNNVNGELLERWIRKHSTYNVQSTTYTMNSSFTAVTLNNGRIMPSVGLGTWLVGGVNLACVTCKRV